VQKFLLKILSRFGKISENLRGGNFLTHTVEQPVWYGIVGFNVPLDTLQVILETIL